MRFNSVQFMIFFPIVVLGYFVVPKKVKNIWLLLASYYFYMSWQPVYALLIFFSTRTTYVFAAMIDESDSQSAKKMFLAVNIVVNIAILFYFKYFNFFVETLLSLAPSLSITKNNNMVAVVGISFYTFQSLGYTIDVYRGTVKREKNFLDYMLFVSFFPQLVAGPIERSSNLLPQLKKTYKFDYDRVTDGLVLMAWGFFKKIVIADGLAVIVDYVYNNVYTFTGLSLILATLMFSIQIYCDFSGYSDIAIGAANVLGIKLMRNFYHPYFSQNIAEFWSRWHISLSKWLEDYIFMPYVWSRKNSSTAIYQGFVLVFFISGLWHGADWTFVVWGLIHGLYRIVDARIKKPRKKMLKKLKISQKNIALQCFDTIVTFLLVSFSYIFFRANTMSDAIYVVKNLFNNGGMLFTKGYFTRVLDLISFTTRNGYALVWCMLFMLMVELWEGKSSIEKRVNGAKWFVRWPFYYALVLLILFFGTFGQSRFIYFQF